MRRTPLLSLVALAALLLLTLGLRVLRLELQPLWWDEGYSVFFATRPLPELIARTAIDIHPPLYYVLLQLWTNVVGRDVVSLRLLSVLAGAAIIPLGAYCARALFGRRTAWLTGLLLAFSPLLVYYSQEVRMYGPLTGLALASIAFQLRLLEPGSTARPRVWLWIGYVAFTALALYTEYYAVFVAAAQIAVVALFYLRPRKASVRLWLTSWAATALLYLPWLLYSAPKLYAYVTAKVGIEQYARLDPLTYFAQHLVAFSTGHLTPDSAVAPASLVFFALALGAIWSRPRGLFTPPRALAAEPAAPAFTVRLRGGAIATLFLLLPLSLGWLVNLVYPFHPIRYERLLLFAAPFFLMLAARGLSLLLARQKALGVAALGLIALASAASLFQFYTVERYPDEDYRPLIAQIERAGGPGDLVYAVYPWQIGYLAAYYHGAPLDLYEVPSDLWMRDREAGAAELARLHARYPRAWLLAYQRQGHILEDRIAVEYANDYLLVDQTSGNTRLSYFARGDATGSGTAALVFPPDLTITVQNASWTARPGATSIAMAAFAANAGTDAYNYSLRILDTNGNKLAQVDGPLAAGAVTLRRGLILPIPTAGKYTLALVAYRRTDGAPLALSDGRTEIVLAQFTVAP